MTSLFRLTVAGVNSSQLLLRVINVVVQQGCAISAMTVHASDENMRIRIDVETASGRTTDVMVEKLSSLVEVAHVLGSYAE